MLIWQLVLIQVTTFVLIVVFLRWLLYSHVSHALRRLKQLNQENLEKENVLKEELERAKRDAAREIKEGQQKAEEIKRLAREAAEKDREEIVGRARKEAKRLISEAIRDCQRKGTELTLEMQEKSVYLATDIVKSIFTEKGRGNLHSQLIDELIVEIEALEKGKVKATGKEAEIICAYPLGKAQEKKLIDILSAKLNRGITLKKNIDEEIIAGLIIRLGGFVIDGSIRNKLKKILPVMKEKVKEAAASR